MPIVESSQGNGVEAWRQLSQTYDPMTDARFAHLVISVVGSRLAKNADVQFSLVSWERQMLRIEKDHKETISPKIKRERCSCTSYQQQSTNASVV